MPFILFSSFFPSLNLFLPDLSFFFSNSILCNIPAVSSQLHCSLMLGYAPRGFASTPLALFSGFQIWVTFRRIDLGYESYAPPLTSGRRLWMAFAVSVFATGGRLRHCANCPIWLRVGLDMALGVGIFICL